MIVKKNRHCEGNSPSQWRVVIYNCPKIVPKLSWNTRFAYRS